MPKKTKPRIRKRPRRIMKKRKRIANKVKRSIVVKENNFAGFPPELRTQLKVRNGWKYS